MGYQPDLYVKVADIVFSYVLYHNNHNNYIGMPNNLIH